MPKLPIEQFIKTRLAEHDPNFQVREGTGFYDLAVKPLSFILQPFADDAARLQVAQSLLRILATDDPNAFDEEAVDAILSNVYVTRVPGGLSGGVARVYYDSPVDREWPATGATFVGATGLLFTNPAPYAMTSAQMSTQIEDGNYYYDIPVQALDFGSAGDLDVNQLVTLSNDPDVISVTNKVKFKGGLSRETNLEVIERARNSIGVRDLVTGKGLIATYYDNFAAILKELQPIGFGDPEMMRDVVYNTHIGGRVDGFFKTASASVGVRNFLGVLTDTTRQTFVSTNVQLKGTAPHSMRNANIDRSGNRAPVVQEIAPFTRAVYTVPVDLTMPQALATNASIKITIDGIVATIRIAGAIPSATERTEIVALINAAFGVQVAFFTPTSFELRSVKTGLNAQVKIEDPSTGSSALLQIFGITPGDYFESLGTAPFIYTETSHYTVNDADGTIARVLGPTKLPLQLTGITTANTFSFSDATADIFSGDVAEGYLLTITDGPNAGDYRIMGVEGQIVTVDKKFVTTAGSVSYYITDTAIKDGQTVYVKYYYNPLSIDIGPLVKLDQYGFLRGVRPGREDYTITDVSFLRIRSIQIIDPLTFEPTGEVLNGVGGFGRGGFGSGAFGIGNGSDYRLIINSPEERFSAFEDAYIVLNPGFIGLSFAVEFDYAPEVLAFHEFARSDRERVLTADLLMRHFLPAYVSGTIYYSVDTTDASIPDNDTLTDMVGKFIERIPAGQELDLSDVTQYIKSVTDPFKRYKAYVKPYELKAVIHNTDGTKTIIRGNDTLKIPTLDPFPIYTKHPLSGRIAHWMADTITMIRLP